jgi:hypothetical protein
VGGSQDSDLDFCDQVVNLGEAWVNPLLALNDFGGCQMSKYPTGYDQLHLLAGTGWEKIAEKSRLG